MVKGGVARRRRSRAFRWPALARPGRQSVLLSGEILVVDTPSPSCVPPSTGCFVLGEILVAEESRAPAFTRSVRFACCAEPCGAFETALISEGFREVLADRGPGNDSRTSLAVY